jgi:DNA-binding GntR family transcriptional regulator
LASARAISCDVLRNFRTLFPDHEKHSLDEQPKLLDALGDQDVERTRAIAERHVLDAGR